MTSPFLDESVFLGLVKEPEDSNKDILKEFDLINKRLDTISNEINFIRRELNNLNRAEYAKPYRSPLRPMFPSDPLPARPPGWIQTFNR